MDFACSSIALRAAGLGLALLALPSAGCIIVDDSDDVGATGSDLEPGECVGPEEQLEVPADAACTDCAPAWGLEDFQPRSCGYEQTYGLNTFEGQVTVVALLAGWCGFCQSQAEKMEQLRIELGAEGVDVMMVAVNGTTAASAEDQQKLVDRCSFPLFQDTEAVDAWAMHGGGQGRHLRLQQRRQPRHGAPLRRGGGHQPLHRRGVRQPASGDPGRAVMRGDAPRGLRRAGRLPA